MALYDQQNRGPISADDPMPERWVRYWYQWVAVSFLRAYFETAGAASFLPPGRPERELLLGIFLLDKAVYELGYELNNRPDWVHIPLCGITDLMPDEWTSRTGWQPSCALNTYRLALTARRGTGSEQATEAGHLMSRC